MSKPNKVRRPMPVPRNNEDKLHKQVELNKALHDRVVACLEKSGHSWRQAVEYGLHEFLDENEKRFGIKV